MHPKKRKELSGRGYVAKTPVMGILERNTPEPKGNVRAFVIPFVESPEVKGAIRKYVKPGAELHTDGATWYKGLSREYTHQSVDHHALEYVRGHVHTNSIEGFFSVLKRTLKGTYVAPRPKHLQRYVEEQAFCFNARECRDGERFPSALAGADGKRLTYKALTKQR
ncbi:MAG TPA: IS1595 family transposase [Candidatus Binatia bacterium]|nr:IS1595 family transposase [Candidatus Binatia bacterium]